MSLTNPSTEVFHDLDIDCQEPDQPSRPRWRADEFPATETHGIALWPGNRLLAESRNLGWHDVYVSLATEASWVNTLHAVPHYCLAYCSHRPASVSRRISGERTLSHVELQPRLFGVVPADCSSMWTLVGSPDIQLIYLRRSMVDRLAEDVLGADSDRVALVPKLGFSDGMLEQLALALLDTALNDDGAGDGLYADHLARMLALHVLRRHSTRPPHDGDARLPGATSSVDRLNHVRNLIESTLDEDLSLERLAGEAGIGTHAFSAAFLRAFGVSPHHYVVQRRIERAKKLLRESDLPVATIAVQTGFASQSHLASVFKRTVGVTPGNYQRTGRRN